MNQKEYELGRFFFEYIDVSITSGWSLGGAFAHETKQRMTEDYSRLEGNFKEYYLYITLFKWQFTVGYRTKLRKWKEEF